MQVGDELLKSLLLFGRTLELEQQMFRREIIGDGSSIVAEVRFRTRIAAQGDTLTLVNLLRDERPRVKAGTPLRMSIMRRDERQRESNEAGSESHFAEH